jgi:hypothetical protein
VNKYSQSRNLLLDIASCPSFGGNDDCKVMFDTQKCNSDKWLPVPWQGHLEQAKILFIGSNPSPLENGVLASKSWFDGNELVKIEDFYESRFDFRGIDKDGSKLKWSKDGKYYRMSPLDPENFRFQKYWSVIKDKWASAILSKYLANRKRGVEAGKDYALTEIVHCYSNEDSILTQPCKEKCSDSYFPHILSWAKSADVLAVMGSHATPIMNDYFARHPELSVEQELDWHPIEQRKKNGVGKINVNLFGRDRIIVALPHPTAWQFKALLNLHFTPAEIDEIQDFIK